MECQIVLILKLQSSNFTQERRDWYQDLIKKNSPGKQDSIDF
jgi:hypothetical protein